MEKIEGLDFAFDGAEINWHLGQSHCEYSDRSIWVVAVIKEYPKNHPEGIWYFEIYDLDNKLRRRVYGNQHLTICYSTK